MNRGSVEGGDRECRHSCSCDIEQSMCLLSVGVNPVPLLWSLNIAPCQHTFQTSGVLIVTRQPSISVGVEKKESSKKRKVLKLSCLFLFPSKHLKLMEFWSEQYVSQRGLHRNPTSRVETQDSCNHQCFLQQENRGGAGRNKLSPIQGAFDFTMEGSCTTKVYKSFSFIREKYLQLNRCSPKRRCSKC